MSKTPCQPAPYCNEARPSIQLQQIATERSGQVKAIGYDEATRVLAVEFRHGCGALYCYANVAPEVHEAFMAAESLGKFHGAHIKALPFVKYHAEDDGHGHEFRARPIEAPHGA